MDGKIRTLTVYSANYDRGLYLKWALVCVFESVMVGVGSHHHETVRHLKRILIEEKGEQHDHCSAALAGRGKMTAASDGNRVSGQPDAREMGRTILQCRGESRAGADDDDGQLGVFIPD